MSVPGAISLSKTRETVSLSGCPIFFYVSLTQGAQMKMKNLAFERGFRVALGNEGSQAAEMVLMPGDAEGGPENRHLGADQWLYVLSGTGIATVNGKRHDLRQGVLMLIERENEHEIRNTGDDLLRTLNFYVPPAYTSGGETLPRGRDF